MGMQNNNGKARENKEVCVLQLLALEVIYRVSTLIRQFIKHLICTKS